MARKRSVRMLIVAATVVCFIVPAYPEEMVLTTILPQGGGGGEFSDGGEAKGKARSLGNADDYGLSFLTAGKSRLSIDKDGGVVIGIPVAQHPYYNESNGYHDVVMQHFKHNILGDLAFVANWALVSHHGFSMVPILVSVYGGIYAQDYYSTSSRRWKEDIRPIDDALGKVLRLRGVYFTWKESQRPDLGMIAEEVGQVVPEVVGYEMNGIDARAINYSRLTAVLVEAVKEQQKTIRTQEQRILALEQTVAGLRQTAKH